MEPNLGLKSLFRHYNIGIYARVSTGSTEQLHSLGTQVSAFILHEFPDGFLEQFVNVVHAAHVRQL